MCEAAHCFASLREGGGPSEGWWKESPGAKASARAALRSFAVYVYFGLTDEVPTAQKTPPGTGAGRGKKLSKQKYYGILQFSEIFLHKKGRNA